MSRGFSLVEVVVALLVLQVGILAAAGMIFIAQGNLTRAELTLRGVLESQWIGDSVLWAAGGDPMESGLASFPWGEVSWRPGGPGVGGLRLVATRAGGTDTLAVIYRWAPIRDRLLWNPGAVEGGPEP